MEFSVLCERYLSDKESGRRAVRPNTLEGYRSAVRAHLLPAWSGREVESIGWEEVQAWADSFPGGRGAEKAFKTLRQVVRWAIASRLVTMADPTVGVAVARPARRPARTLDERELNRLVYECRGEEWEAVVLCQACLGLRRCEACALEWGDIDLRSGEVRVERGRHVVGGRDVTWGTKTAASARTVVLPRFAVERLREVRRRLRPSRSDLLCALRPNAVSRRFRSWCARHGLAGMTMMQLRHTWATLCVKAGVRIEVVAMALGHTGVEMAYRRYVSRSTDLLRANVRRFADLVLRAAPESRLSPS